MTELDVISRAYFAACRELQALTATWHEITGASPAQEPWHRWGLPPDDWPIAAQVKWLMLEERQAALSLRSSILTRNYVPAIRKRRVA